MVRPVCAREHRADHDLCLWCSADAAEGECELSVGLCEPSGPASHCEAVHNGRRIAEAYRWLRTRVLQRGWGVRTSVLVACEEEGANQSPRVAVLLAQLLESGTIYGDVWDALGGVLCANQQKLGSLRCDAHRVARDLKALKENMQGVARDLKALKENTQEVTRDLKALKENMQGVARDLKALKENTQEVARDQRAIREDLETLQKGVKAIAATLSAAAIRVVQ
eukprot:m51a1_g277 hypothetical protein (224) ;mRNA; r:268946-269834